MAIACFILWLWHTLWHLVVAYICTFAASEQGFKMDAWVSKKQSKLAKRYSIWSFFFMMKVNCMPFACFKFLLFILNAFHFSVYVVAYYAHSHPNRCSKWTYKSPKNSQKMFFLRLYFHEEGHLYSKCLFNILTI